MDGRGEFAAVEDAREGALRTSKFFFEAFYPSSIDDDIPPSVLISTKGWNADYQLYMDLILCIKLDRVA